MTVCIEALTVRYFILGSLASAGTVGPYLPAVKFSLRSMGHGGEADEHMKSLHKSVR